MRMVYLMLLSMMVADVSFAQPCQIPGMKEAPQRLNCMYRDGWYIRHFIDISCKDEQYLYEISTHGTGVYEKGPLRPLYQPKTGNLEFHSPDSLKTRIKKTLFGHYSGIVAFEDFLGYSEDLKCKSID